VDPDAVEIRVVGCLVEKQRSERLHAFADLAAVEETLTALVERELVARHQRRPGQKEERYSQLLGGEAPVAAVAEPAEAEPPAEQSGPAEEDDRLERLERLERELAALRDEVTRLREALGEG
jgi:uncharacterized protein YceH (UPF0502 family)